MIKHQKGQSLVLYGLLLVGLIALMGLAVDFGMLVYFTLHARGAVSNACVYAADTMFQGGNAQNAFYQSLAANSIPIAGYQPTSGSGTGLIRGITVEPTSIRTAIRYQTPTYFMQIVGIRTMTVSAHARCSTTGQKLLPIAVKYNDYLSSYNTHTAVPLLGNKVSPDHAQGNKYDGAVFPFLWCVNSASDKTPNINCPYVFAVQPNIVPPSSQSDKHALIPCWTGYACADVLSPVGTDIPILDGVTGGLTIKDWDPKVGDVFLAMIYSGTINPAGQNWQNVTVMGWAIFIVDDAKKQSTVWGHAITAMTTDVNSLYYQNKTLLYPEEIPWSATTGW